MEIYKDTDFVLSTEKTNKVLAVLTIIFTLAIPSTVIGTFYGMNVNLPGGIGDNLMVLGPFTTFIISHSCISNTCNHDVCYISKNWVGLVVKIKTISKVQILIKNKLRLNTR